MKSLTALIVAALLFSGHRATGAEPTQPQWLTGIELGIAEHYDQAVSFFVQLSAQDSTDPAPRFFLATIWQTRMMDFETKTWENSFMAEIETTLRLSQARLRREPNNIEMQYYYASALAYKSFQISRQGQYLSGLRLGLTAMNELNEIVAKDSTYYDAYLGIGSYLYWRSYLTRKFAWLPFFSDQREKGIALVQTSFEQGTISKWAALSNLAWIYMKEERFEEAIECAQAGLSNFPNSRFFLWPLGDAQFYQNDFAGALETYQLLLESVTLEEFNNRYNETVLHLKIATCFFELNHLQKAKIHAQTVLHIEPHDEVLKRLKEKKRDAKDLLKRIDELSASANE
jgi:tetratricopeptide (TPR) repeat protein